MYEILAVVVPLLVGGIFTWFKLKAGKDYAKVLEALEAGVTVAWDTYGRERKIELGGKFPKEDRNNLRELAKATARDISGELGLDFDKILPPAFQDVAIKTLVRKVKSSS